MRTASLSALDAAVKLLTIRDHSRKELFNKLKRRKLATEAVNAALDKCEALGYLDDEKTARTYARELTQKGFGPGRIRMALKKRGLPPGLIDAILSEKSEDDSEIESARKVLEKKLATMKREPEGAKKRAKLYRFLYSRGFSPPVISNLLRQQ